MIYRDRIHVKLSEKQLVSGTQKTVVVFEGDVPGAVTFMDTNVTFDPNSAKVSSRLRIFLKPFSRKIPPNVATLLALSWGPWTNLVIDGAVELHYRNGRLNHYEIIAKAV